jgi:hypothetical protein
MAICGGAGYVSSGSERLMKELETHKEITWKWKNDEAIRRVFRGAGKP